MELVPITISGRPAREVPQLPEVALEALAGTAMLYRETGFEPPWIGYLVVEGGDCVGTCAFKCAPSDDRAELAYFTFPGHEGRGLATRMCAGLVAIARTAQPGERSTCTVRASSGPCRVSSSW